MSCFPGSGNTMVPLIRLQTRFLASSLSNPYLKNLRASTEVVVKISETEWYKRTRVHTYTCTCTHTIMGSLIRPA